MTNSEVCSTMNGDLYATLMLLGSPQTWTFRMCIIFFPLPNVIVEGARIVQFHQYFTLGSKLGWSWEWYKSHASDTVCTRADNLRKTSPNRPTFGHD